MKLKKYLTKTTFDVQPSIVYLNTNNEVLKGLTLLHISDLHIDTKTSFEDILALIDIINQNSCDLVVFTGDIIDTNVKNIEETLLLFQKIEKNTYYVSGNHDLVYGYKKLHSIMQQCNIKCLDNDYVVLSTKGKHFLLWGLSDRFSKFFQIKRDEKELIQQINAFDCPKVFLAHQPKDYRFGLQTNSSIFLCGHTHAGQIFPFNYMVRLFQPFIKGVHYIKGMAIYVNSGLGSWGIKYRFMTQAEITIIQVQ